MQCNQSIVSIDDDGRVQNSDSPVIPGILVLAPSLGSRSNEPPTPFPEPQAIWKLREAHRPRKLTEGV